MRDGVVRRAFLIAVRAETTNFRYGAGVTLAPIAILQMTNGAAWFVLGALNLIVLWWMGGQPVFGWWGALLLGIVVAALLMALTLRTIRAALVDAEPAVGINLAAPSEAMGRCLGSIGLVVLILLTLSLVPGASEYRGLAAVMFVCFGASYLPLAIWVRRFEEAEGVIVAQAVNRWGMRSGALRVLRLPR